MPVATRGIRHDLDDFWAIGQPFEGGLDHTPIVALVEDPPGTVTARCFRDPCALLLLPEDTICIQSWPGQIRSDLFRYTVEEARPYLRKESPHDADR